MLPVTFDHLLQQRRVMLLQGPMGPFFAQLGEALRAQGAHVWKVNFNAGDELFYSDESTLRYGGLAHDWPAQCVRWIDEFGIGAIVMFGQCRPLHAAAIQVAKHRELALYVFEEGYVRPDYVTLESGGVNAHSSLERDPAFYQRAAAARLPEPPAPEPTRQNFRRMAELAMRYGWAMWRGQERYPHYRHHRSLHPIVESARWWRGAARQQISRVLEHGEAGRLAAPERHKRFFLVPLQVNNDAQIVHHSRYDHVADFIVETAVSFAKHADPRDWLVFKHHPLDIAYTDYRTLIRRLAKRLGLGERLRYLHEANLPALIKAARGVVTINSTTGLQSLYHATPVFTASDSFYDVDGLVYAGPLEAFWRDPGVVDMPLLRAYRAHLIRQTQVNASFYADAPALASIIEAKRLDASSCAIPSADAQAAT